MAATQALLSAQTVRAPAASTSGRRTAAAAAAARRPLARPAARRAPAPPRALNELMQLAELDIDWSDPDTLIGALGAVLGLALGIGVPAFYASRDERDEERLEELRALNRATKEETGEYMTPEEINAIRPARWTDRREFVDND